MLDYPSWAPQYADLESPNPARVYDYLLGGACNSAADRALAREVLTAMPEARHVVQVNRAFLRRTIRFLVSMGVRQFIDIGSGTQTVGNVHDTAQQADPRCRVVYVDNDPIAIAHSGLIVEGNERTTVVGADFRRPDQVLSVPALHEQLDFDKPIGLLLFALLHYLPDSTDPARLIAAYREALPPGSYLALSHATDEGVFCGIGEVYEIYRRIGAPLALRTKAEISRLIDGFSPVDPGIVYVPQWRPESAEDADCPGATALYGVVAELN